MKAELDAPGAVEAPPDVRAFIDSHIAFVTRVLRRAGTPRAEISDQAAEQVERLATPEALIDQKMTRALLNGVIDQMNATWRATFVLYELEEMSMTEVADTLGIPRGTVASRLRGARNEFRARLAAIDGFGAVAVRSRSAP